MTGESEKAKTSHKLRELASRTSQLLDRLEPIEEEVLNRPGRDGGWSVMQILSHVMQSEELSYRYVEKKLSFNPKLQRAGLSAQLRGWFLKFFLATGIKFGAPRGLQTEDLRLESGIPAVRDRWARQRMKMEQYLESIKDDLYLKAIFKHPISGRLSLRQMVSFFGDHLERHSRQIEARLKE